MGVDDVVAGEGGVGGRVGAGGGWVEDDPGEHCGGEGVGGSQLQSGSLPTSTRIPPSFRG